ncbi:hypothetical protein [Microbulbifer sp. SAOS-129_SWC]|uniref:hypothetical protein n=1 Tax=Microbulbifer sp. SAOS-129_SWC TaxID=3145235 RepID=UPI0032172A17
MNPILSRLIYSLLFLVAGFCHASPAYFIDTPELLRVAQDAVHRTYPEIPKSELVASDDTVQFSCTPGQKRYLQEEAAKQCLKNPFSPTPCSVQIRFMLRSTMEQTTTAYKNGQCHFSTRYRPVIVEFFQDGASQVRRPEIQFSSGDVGDCSADHTPEEIADLARAHEALLEKEYATATPALGTETFVHPDGYFMVDYQTLFKNAQNAILQRFPQEKTADLHLTDADFSFVCDDSIHWKPVDRWTLQLPSQKESTGLCYSAFTFVRGSGAIEEVVDSRSPTKMCRSVIPDEGYYVRVYSDGTAEARVSSIGYSREGPCDSINGIPSVDEAIAQYRQASATD